MIATAAVLAGATVVAPQAAQAANCSWGRDGTASWKGYATCADRSSRVAVYCKTQSQGEVVLFGPWVGPGQRSVQWCPDDTQSMSVWADWPE